MKLKFEVKIQSEIDKDELSGFVWKTEGRLIPSLSSRINVDDFIERVYQNATFFIARDIENDIIVALNIVYVNQAPDRSYATFLAVLEEFESMGIGARLILNAIRYCKKVGSACYSLSMRKSNETMLAFYLKNGFVIESEKTYPNSDEIQVDLKLVF
ncbi:GNAT family N-acetyltransferase [Parabacteroides distasonis]|nr:GNAT family N-acetyltransferase [Parabacteroides distasonis]